MDVKILDRKSGWILGKVSLLEYIKSLTEENFQYDIQRGIVSNPFLDTILDAVVENKPLAPVSLVSKGFEDGDKCISINQFNILDGLQRTFRFWIYYQLAKLAIEKNSNDYRIVTKEFKTTCDNYSLAVSPRQVRSLFKHDNAINENLYNGNISLAEDTHICRAITMFVQHCDKKYSRKLNYFSDQLNVVETSTLYKVETETYSLDCLYFLECIFVNNKRMKNMLKELCCKEQENTYIIEVDKSGLGLTQAEVNNFGNLYAFALASSMNNKTCIEIPQELVFSWGVSPIFASFDYNKNIVYNEYYDIYDVFNDWLHASDILTAFMKMYQIAEYMIYRSQMAEIVNRANIKQSFLRETKNLSSKYIRSERETIISEFPKLFHSFNLDPVMVSNSWTFVDKYFGKTNRGNHYLDTTNPQQDIDKGVARFIYDVRCAIVHNKESEFHILYNNYEEYKDIVPLMRQINAIMSEKILETINSQTPLIHYQSQKLDLY